MLECGSDGLNLDVVKHAEEMSQHESDSEDSLCVEVVDEMESPL